MSLAKRLKRVKESRTPGTFVALPTAFLRSPVCAALSPHACKLLLDLSAQYNQRNNGDLCATWSFMEMRGWKSRDTLGKALAELEEKYIIERTRQGGRNRPTLLRIAFYNIDECGGKLDVPATRTPSSKWHNEGALLVVDPLRSASKLRAKNASPVTPAVPDAAGLPRVA